MKKFLILPLTGGAKDPQSFGNNGTPMSNIPLESYGMVCLTPIGVMDNFNRFLRSQSYIIGPFIFPNM